MYVGRFIVIGPDIGAYRVSSRSFPNRQVVDREGTLTVAPTADAEPTDNPYVSYNCLRVAGDTAVIGNGSHVDPITEKIERGYPARDALCEALLAMDFEKDSYNTPRIAGTVGEESYIGIVRSDALIVKEVTEPTLVATYESDSPEAYPLNTTVATAAAKAVYDADLEHAVCAAAVSRTESGFETAIENGN